MASLTKRADEIWRDFATDGVVASGAHKPVKADIRRHGREIETILDSASAQGATIYTSKALLDADLVPAANAQAWVVGDATAANNGVYRKVGATGAGSWTRVRDLPYAIIPLTVTGGTADAIVATSSLPIPQGDRAAIMILTPSLDNTGAVTLSVNAETPRSFKGQAGEAMQSGYLVAGAGIALVKVGSEYRTLNDFRIQSLATAAATSATAAAAAQAGAEAAASAVNLRIYDEVADAQAVTVPAAADYVFTFDAEPTARLWKRVGSDPGSVDKFQDAASAWFEGALLPPAIIDLPNEVARTANVTLAAGDMDKAHIFTMSLGTTIDCTLPPANAHIGRMLYIAVEQAAGGLLRLKTTPAQATSVIEDYPSDDFYMWSGEEIILKAAATGWRIRGGRCRPLNLVATRPVDAGGANNISVPTSGVAVELTGFTTTFGGTFWKNGAHGLNGAGQFAAPRRSTYTMTLGLFFTWSTAPTYAAAQIDGASISRTFVPPSTTNLVTNSVYTNIAATGTIFEAQAIAVFTGSPALVVNHTLAALVPRLTVTETPQW